MLTTAAFMALLATTTASPLGSRQVVPNYPPKQQSQGFTLVANVTDPARDFAPSIKYSTFSTIHVGAGQNIAVLDSNTARIFYQNGTAQENWYGQSNILTDGGSPPFPFGIQVNPVQGSETESFLTVNAGQGTPLTLTRFPEPYTYLNGPGTYVACNETVPYYGPNQYFITLRFARSTWDETGGHDNIPEQCVPIRLVPECAVLPELPEGSLSSHEFAIESNCYADVSAIDWSQYGP